jgi:hypothetical protein
VTPGEPVNSPAIRIVIAEDQALVRRGAAMLLSMEPDMEVVGQARNGVEAVELAQTKPPDRQRPVSCRRHRQELRQSHHGKITREHEDRACRTVEEAVAPARMTLVMSGHDFRLLTGGW